MHRSITRLALALSVSMFAPAAALAHPLDSLSGEEITKVVEILGAAGLTTPETRWPLITLREPDKSVVLAWEEGSPEPREAIVNVVTAEGTFKGIVDIAGETVVSFEPATGQSMILLEEFLSAMELALGDEVFVAGLAKRDLTPGDVFCLPLTAGAFGTPGEEGRRLMKVPCYVNPDQSNFYAKPVEGLYAVVDLNGKEVVEVIDTGTVPVPQDPWGYTEEELAARGDMAMRPEAESATLTREGDASFTIEGSKVTWDMWSFRYRVDKRPGVVLSEITADIGEGPRSVLYQANLSEVFVPYMDPTEGWYWRTYMDSGEYGFGIFMSPLRAGVDCPRYATYLPAVFHTDEGAPMEIPDAICIYERSIGDPAWRHFEIFAQSPDTFTPAEGRPSTELIVRYAAEVGNYDYLVDYVFDQSGRIQIRVGSTGLDAVKGVAATSMDSPTAAEDTRYGTLIAPNLVAPNHDHFFNFRLDFDIDGRDNTFVRTGLVPAEAAEGTPRRTLWVTEMSMPRTESEGRYKISPETPAMYHVGNMNVTSALGHHPTYMLNPGNSVAYSPLDVASDPPARRNPYISHTIFVTPYARNEQYAGGEYAFQSDGGDTLATWMEADRAIANTDIVTWYTMGFHHVPRMEDWPVMPMMWKTLTLAPFNFFSRNPAITIASPD